MRYAYRLLMAGFLLLQGPYVTLAADNFRVLVSIKPIHSILAGLMEGTEGPALLFGDGRSPYDADLSGRQRKMLGGADLVIWVGPELEASLQQPIDELPSQVRVVELLSSAEMKILPSRAGDDRRDPFFWLDDRNVILLLNRLTLMLQDADPARAHIYLRNRRKVMQRLARIDREYEYGYRGFKAGRGVQYFDTLQYFAQAYALDLLDHVAESPRQKVSAAALLRVRRRISEGDAVCLLTEKGLPMAHLSLLTEGQDVNLGELDSLGAGLTAGPDLYFELMEHNTRTIKRCLNADMQAADQARQLAKTTDAADSDGVGSGRFILTDHLGRMVTDETMRGRYQLLYFGYTYCPDVCPNTLQVLSLALDRLGGRAKLIQPYFITIDPERDTPMVLRDYIENFDPRLIGVTGSPAMIEAISAQYKARYEKVLEEDTQPDLYLMDHSASLYLVAPDGRFLKKYVYGLSAEQLAAELRSILP